MWGMFLNESLGRIGGILQIRDRNHGLLGKAGMSFELRRDRSSWTLGGIWHEAEKFLG